MLMGGMSSSKQKSYDSRLSSSKSVSSRNGEIVDAINNAGGTSLDDTLDNIPVGKFHWQLLIMCGAVFMADAMEVNLLAFISMCAGAEWDLTITQVAAITSAVFAGEFFGGLFWGPISDRYGRRVGFILAVTVICIAGIFSGLSPNYPTLLVLRMICGFGVGGLTIPFDLLAEFLPKDCRGEFLMMMEYFWTLGSVFVAGAAWLFLDSVGWRGLTFITAIPVIIASIVSILVLPESPRWLMEQGQTAEAERVLIKAAERNETPLPANFTLKADISSHHTPNGSANSLEGIFSNMFNSYKDLVKSENIGYSYELWTLWFCFGLTYYGVILFVSRIYAEDGDDDGDDLKCEFDYQSIFINACAEFVGIFLTLFVVDRWGRPKTMFVTFGIAAVGSLLMGIPASYAFVFTVGLFARAAIVSANSTTWVATPELYKTELRGTGHASCNAATRVGGFLAPFIVDSNLNFTEVGVALFAFNMLATAVAPLLPNMVGLDLDNEVSSEEMESRFMFGGAVRRTGVYWWSVLFGGCNNSRDSNDSTMLLARSNSNDRKDSSSSG